MPEESQPNPYKATGNAGGPPMEHRAEPSARWLAVPFFAIGCAVLAAVGTFVFVELFMSAGDFTEIIAVGFASIALIVGGVIGSIAGVGFARGTHLR
jgi:hypothetical protein